MKTPSTLCGILAAIFTTAAPALEEGVRPEPVAAVNPAEDNHPKIQLAILLDTSGSMQGLINQARTQLWKIVNEFISAKQNGQTPYVEVALYEYGNNAQPAKDHWIRQIQPLTRDLDKISEDLFKLTTNGGEEYCGAVIKRAIKDLAWDKRPDTYKAIFVAGNEPFNQGPVDPLTSCREAIAQGVIVNTIHCGNEAEGRRGNWHTGPALADGKFLNIDQNQAVAAITAPQDAELVKLNEQLNKTYVWYGARGGIARENQVAQDFNAAKAAPAAAAQRAATKASANYYNAEADLVDRAKDKEFKLSGLKAEELPEEMKKMSEAERKDYLERKTAERTDLQTKILALNKAREAYVVQQLKQQGKETLDTAITKAVREQAAKKRIQWEQ